MSLSLSPHLGSTDLSLPPSPFAAVNARARAARGDAAAQQELQGSFSAHLTLTLYGADGRARNVQDGPSPLTGAQLEAGDAAVIDVHDAQGRDISVTLRKDGTYAALERAAGGVIHYDSRSASSASSPVRALADRAARIAALASSAGSDAALTAGAPSALAAGAGTNDSAKDVTVTITDAKGVSRYAGGDHGVVSAWRTTDGVALETVTLDHGVQTDAVRRTDGSGTTTVGGGSMGGTTFVVTHERDGTEHVDVSGGGGSALGAGEAAVSALDAFGERIMIGTDAQGRADVELTDAIGTAFTLNANQAGTSASLAVKLGVGEGTGTRRAELTEDATATSSTGSNAHVTSSLVATARDAKTAGIEPGSLTVTIEANVASSKKAHAGMVETRGTATVAAHAQAQGTLDVAGVTAGRVEDGYRDEQNRQRIAGGSSREAKGAVALDDTAARQILAVEVSALGDDLRARSSPQNSTTHDDGTITIDAFGHRTSVLRHTDIQRVKNSVKIASDETIF